MSLTGYSPSRYSPASASRRAIGVFVLVFLCSILPVQTTRSQGLDADPEALTHLMKLSLEDLVNVEVTTVGKKAERLSEAAAAVYVISQEELRRSGATSFPEALRLVPGMEVARVDGHNWSVSSRGFNDFFANKLLVLMDGRSVYTPLFSGVFWDVQDTLFEDIDRIEVIRGPGASLWGANAVNGVINVITKSAKDTQGVFVSGGGGTEERGFASFRYGGTFKDNAYFRVYGKYFDRDRTSLSTAGGATDDWNMARGGFRVDFEPSARNLMTLQGDVYGGKLNQTFDLATLEPPDYSKPFTGDVRVSGGNMLGRWTHTIAEGSDVRLQAYFDRTIRDAGYYEEDRNTYDVELQHRFPIAERHDLVWGTGYRALQDEIPGGFNLSWDPVERTTQVWNAFVQDEIRMAEDRLRFTLGSKFEHNDYTGFEAQPSGRLSWMAAANQSLWLSVARAVRTPSRAEADLIANTRVVPGASPAFPPTLISLVGNSEFGSEELVAYELGYRIRPAARLSLDAAVFFNDYDRLRTFETTALDFSHFPDYLGIPITAGNDLEGATYGAELASDIELSDWWRVRAAYTFLQVQLHKKPGSTDTTTEADEGANPHHQVSLHSLMNLPRDIELDFTARYVDNLPSLGVRSYFSLDSHLAWRPRKQWEIAIVAQNLLDNRHPEFGPSLLSGIAATEIQRSVYGRVTFRF